MANTASYITLVTLSHPDELISRRDKVTLMILPMTVSFPDVQTVQFTAQHMLSILFTPPSQRDTVPYPSLYSEANQLLAYRLSHPGGEGSH